ncbi:MAG: cysteine desulfurase family protein, partial [Methyloceanibacter sp.]
GVGTLVLKDGVRVEPLIKGGGQEGRRRAGTENVPGIVGFGVAAALAAKELADVGALAALRDQLEEGVRAVAADAVIVSASAPRLPNTSCIAVPGVKAETLVIGLDLAGIAVSAGSACSSGKVEVSHVLEAMGLSPEIAGGAVRVSLGFGTKNDDIKRYVSAFGELIKRLKRNAKEAA